MARFRLTILSDIHYAGATEQARGSDYELRSVPSPLRRWLVRQWRHRFWLRDPFAHNGQLDRFLTECPESDLIIANGDYSCDSGFIGVSDPAACASAQEALGKLRSRFTERLHLTMGDHELGKKGFGSGKGCMKFGSLQITREVLQVPTSWRLERGNFVLLGVASSLAAVPALKGDQLPEEQTDWQAAHEAHLQEIAELTRGIKNQQRVILFCHDPTALPLLGQQASIQKILPQIEHTIIGHLHTNLVFRQAQLMAGIPEVQFIGPTIGRITHALNRAKFWKPFRVTLCPSLAGTQLLRDGGFLTMELDDSNRGPAGIRFHGLPW